MGSGVGPMNEFGPTWMVLTGASRGLGAAICEGFSSELGPGSVVVAFARSESGLENTRNAVQKANPAVKFVSVAEDLSKTSPDQMRTILRQSLEDADGPLTRAVLVHNAGSLGPLDYFRNVEDLEIIRRYFDFNVSSTIPLTKIFLELARTRLETPSLNIINISSLSAISPFSSWGLYCAGKAARDMIFKVFAAEEGPEVNVLNYAPGPLDNEMMVEARTKTGDPGLRAMFEGLHSDNKLLRPEQSVRKLLEILKEGKYGSGDHVDYYDE